MWHQFWPNSSSRLVSVQYLEEKVTRMNWKLYYSRVHGQIHLAAQFTNGVLLHFTNLPWKTGVLVLKGQKMRPHAPETPKLKVTEVSLSGFWNISSHPTSVPSLSQIGWSQLLAPGTLSQTVTLKGSHFSVVADSGHLCANSAIANGTTPAFLSHNFSVSPASR